MSHRHPNGVRDVERLRVLSLVSTDRWIPDVPHTEVPTQARHVALIEYLKNEPEALLDME